MLRTNPLSERLNAFIIKFDFHLSPQKLHDDIVLHTKDVGKFKEYGKDLADSQDTIKDDVLATIRKSNSEVSLAKW